MTTIHAMAIDMPQVEGHPNRKEFSGVLTLVDVASDRPPAGARGHRVVLTRRAAEAALSSLLGMALDYSPSLDRHDTQRKVGIITRVEIVGRKLEIGGYLFAKDFPEIVQQIRSDGNKLGMSYEIADARVVNIRSKVWRLSSVMFTGASILRKDKTAYAATEIALA